MKISTLLGGALVASASTAAAIAVPDIHAKRQSQFLLTTGVQNNGIQTRVELRTMRTQNPDQFNLYMLALREFMSVTQTDPLSYYQIAGIHGRPYSAWGGWTSQAGPGGYGGGYCTHVSNIFLPWHRPYLALYEQQLYSHVQNVANSFPAASRARWQAAAANFRMPYWDWAVVPTCQGCQVFPEFVSSAYISVTSPTGQQTVVNPLYRYDFHPIVPSDMAYNPFASWVTTLRYPTSWQSNAVSQDPGVTSQIASNQPNFKQRLYNLFTNYNNFNQFSNEAWIANSGVQGADSLESLHDSLHTITGSNGHMTYLDYSSFDPIFWLHHTNIDRIWAMWSTINPNTYVQQANAQKPTYTYPAGTSLDATSGLAPFNKNTQGLLYTSNDVSSTTSFGYVYPETANGASAASVRAAVNSLYGSGVPTGRRLKRDSDASDWHYIANIVSQKTQLNGSYAVYVFLGEPDADALTWPTAANLVGTHGVAANFADADNDQLAAMDVPVTGTVPLTTALQDKVAAGELADTGVQSVSAYLLQRLVWKVAKYDGTVVPAANVPDLSVSVVAAEVMPAASPDDFPTWSPYVSLANVTAGQDGGHDDAWWGM
ncbi:hypothetical protein ANO11243_092550 [Dothideomycetidae sp. 11243]|nr:hypothetical protein ANO11243_092550 [fungal sp. No.11243]